MMLLLLLPHRYPSLDYQALDINSLKSDNDEDAESKLFGDIELDNQKIINVQLETSL